MSRFNFKRKTKTSVVPGFMPRYKFVRFAKFPKILWSYLAEQNNRAKKSLSTKVINHHKHCPQCETYRKSSLRKAKQENREPVHWQVCRVHERCLQAQHLAHCLPKNQEHAEKLEEADAEFYETMPSELNEDIIGDRNREQPDYAGNIDYEKLSLS